MIQLRTTDQIVTILLHDYGEGFHHSVVTKALYRWRRDGKVTNHGGNGIGEARWDLDQVLTYAAAYRLVYGRMPWQKPSA